MIREFLIVTQCLVISPAFAQSANEVLPVSTTLSNLIRSSLTEKIADSEIRLPALVKLFSQKPMSDFAEITTAQLLQEKAIGVAVFEVVGKGLDGEIMRQTIQTPFEAWRKVPVATHRIYPNAQLKNEDFRIQAVNVARNPAREYRGVMVPANLVFNGQQSKQTILEGQFVVDSAIQRLPDIRKGDLVKLELISGDLSLTTQAVTEEAASIGGQIRVMTSKTKRELIGRVKEDRSVEVSL